MTRCTHSLVVAASLAVLVGGSAVLAGLPEYQAAVRAEPSLISYYTFDSDTGTSVADTFTTALPDPSGAIAGSGTTLTAAADALGGAGQALSLNGSGWVNFGTADLFNFYDSTIPVPAEVSSTIEMWVRPGWDTFPGPIPEYDPCPAGARDGGLTRWSLHLERWLNNAGVYVGCFGMHFHGTDLHPVDWYHLAYVFDAGSDTSKVYVNGVLIGSFGGIGCDLSQPFQIGASSPTGAEAFIGSIDEVSVYNAALSSQQIGAHYVALNGAGFDAPAATSALIAAYESAVNADSPIGFYTFEGDTTSATDSGSVHANGTLVAPTYWTSGFAGGQALGLDVSGAGRVVMGAVPAFAFPGGVGTIEAWISPDPKLRLRDASEGRPAVLSCGDDFSAFFHYGLELRKTDQSLGVESYNDGYNTPVGIPGGLPSTAGKWYHVAAVFDAGTVTYYIDGKPMGAPQPLNLAPPEGLLSNFQIGAVDPQGDWGFVGKIDEVALYGTALSAQRIAAHYAAPAMTFSIHEHAFVNPTNMDPVDVTLFAPAGQTTPAGLQLTFSFDSSIITVTIPALGVTLAPGTAYPIPTGLGSALLHVAPVPGAYGSTTLSVSANAESGWIFGDSVTFSLSLADQGLILIDDDFDNSNIGTNPGKPGGGFFEGNNGTTRTESGTLWTVSNGGYDWSWGAIYNKQTANFKFMNPQGVRLEWVIGNVDIHYNGSTGFLGGGSADCRHELGIISANRINTGNFQNHELFVNNNGGFYVNLFYNSTGSTYPTQNLAVTGSIRVVNGNHGSGCDGEGCGGLQTPVTFSLDPATVASITPQKPLVVTIELDQAGWKVGFSLDANPVYTILSGGAPPENPNDPAYVRVSTSDSKIVGAWGAFSLNDAAISGEFNNGAFVWASFQNFPGTVPVDRNIGSIDRVKACVGCTLVTDCPDPFADANGDTYVDQTDFGIFQACWTGLQGGVPAGCRCFDKNASGSIDIGDLAKFLNCAAVSGPLVPVPKNCDDH